MKTAKFYQLNRIGGAEAFEIKELSIPQPKTGEVRIKVEAIGINRAESLYQSGSYIYQPKIGSIPGYEAAGIIDAVGDDVEKFELGDRVSTIPAFSMQEYGVYGEYAIVPAYAVSHYPENLTVEEAASIWMQYITAYGALIHYGNLKQGDYVLLTAATGGLGVAAIQIARMVGAISIATTRKESKRKFLESQNSDRIIVTDSEDLETKVMEITEGQGTDLIFDAVLGKQLITLANIAKPGSSIIAYGALDPDALTTTIYPFQAAIGKGLDIRGYTLFELTYSPVRFSQTQPYDSVAYTEAIAFVKHGLETGQLKPIIDRVFPFEEMANAHRYLLDNQQQGKVVVRL
ncbi:MAG: zinc-dependent alcohol dehydrogenase family protein [Cyanobacteria bacterium P01_A01_bin.83]